MAIPKMAADGRLGELFPISIDPPPPGVFELGILLGGTVSAGAYTAGALDFLLQALEAWHQTNPPHKVLIKAAAGTSGGAVCTAILGILSSHGVPHVTDDQPIKNQANIGNPLWDLWVNEFQLSRLLSTSDVNAGVDADAGTGVVPGDQPAGDGTPVQHVPSLLNCAMIDEGAASLVAFAQNSPVIERPYFQKPFRITTTFSNVRGVPFTINAIPTYGQYTGAAFVEHDDIARFVFPNGVPYSDEEKREDEFWLDPNGNGAYAVGYQVLANYATASGSMPLGLVARILERPAEHYYYRPSIRPSLQAPYYEISWPAPDWSELPEVVASGSYKCTAVDGGCFNNDPVTYLHRDLAGLIGKNPQRPDLAYRAMLMIDPLVDEPSNIPPSGRSLLRVAESVVGMFVSGARYLTADMDLFRSQDIFSRYQLVPTRPEPGKVGEAAIAGSLLGALAGWGAREFRIHDFLLGRANMQAYLKNEMVLQGNNALFDKWPDPLREQFAADINAKPVPPGTPRDRYYLPILPDLTGKQEVLPSWPTGKLDADSLSGPIQDRLKLVLDQLRMDNIDGFLSSVFGPAVISLLSSFLTGKLVSALKKELQSAGL